MHFSLEIFFGFLEIPFEASTKQQQHQQQHQQASKRVHRKREKKCVDDDEKLINENQLTER